LTIIYKAAEENKNVLDNIMLIVNVLKNKMDIMYIDILNISTFCENVFITHSLLFVPVWDKDLLEIREQRRWLEQTIIAELGQKLPRKIFRFFIFF